MSMPAASGCTSCKVRSALWIFRSMSRRCLRFIWCQLGWVDWPVAFGAGSFGVAFMVTLSVFNSTWLGPVDENRSISPSGSGHSPSQDNACHHPHNRQYRSHAINRAETLHRTFGLSCQAMLCLRCYVSSRSPISAGVSGSDNHPPGAANAIKGGSQEKTHPFRLEFFLLRSPLA